MKDWDDTNDPAPIDVTITCPWENGEEAQYDVTAATTKVTRSMKCES